MAVKVAKNVLFCATVVTGIALVFWWINPSTSATALSVPAVVTGEGSTDLLEAPEAEGHVASTVAVDQALSALNRAFESDWEKVGLSSAPTAAPLKVARRLSLGLSGSIPSLQEIRVLQQQPSDQQVQYLSLIHI